MQLHNLKKYFMQSGLSFTFNAGFSIEQKQISILRTRTYVDLWKDSYENNWYNFKLDDQSMFQFSDTNYHFIQCPLDIVSQGEFKRSLDPALRVPGLLEEAYENEISTSAIKNHFTPIRMDLDYGSYKEGRHPAAHIHFGLDNEVRVGLKRLMTPESFVLFIIRQAYPDAWTKLLDSSLGSKIEKKIRNSLIEVDDNYWNPKDNRELYLN